MPASPAVVSTVQPEATALLPRRWRDIALPRHDAIAVAGVAGFCLLAGVWSVLAGLTFTPSIHLLALFPAVFGLIAFGYHAIRPRENQLFQILLYVALWAALPIAGTRLTFLANLANMPLQSDLFVAIDRALGFSWIDWANFINAYPMLARITGDAYMSYAFQPYVALVIVALAGDQRRNAKLLLAAMIALAVTILVSALIPASEPAHAYGYPTPAWDALEALRNGRRHDLPYIGIVCFPSYHAAMAVLFTAVYRDLRWAIVPAGILNAVMLISVPFSGDHYLADVIAGVCLAIASIWAADRIIDAKGNPEFAAG